jgi:hypothetical protein
MKNYYTHSPTRTRFSFRLGRLLLAALLLCGTFSLQAQPACPTYAGNIAYVNASATVGTNDGTSWTTAFLTLEEALDAARTCGVTQIWVARGTYQPTAYPVGITSSGTLSNADFSFHLVNGVAIYGGFSGLGFETQLSQRNARLNKTILDGGGTTRHVLLSVNDGLATVVDGFTITGGNAFSGFSTVEGVGITGSRGAGMFLTGSSITLNDLIFTGNQADYAGGMIMIGGASVLTNMVFVGNSSTNAGGAMEADNSTFTLTNGVFAGNVSTGNGGGAMVLFGGSQTLRNVVFSQNRASRSNPVSFGGAITNSGSTLDLINCTFFGNSAVGTGGVMYNVNGSTIRDKNGIYFGNTAASSPNVINFTPGLDTFTPTTTLTGTDPLFVNSADPDGPDNVWMTADDGLTLQSTSPAINAGTDAGAPATDILGAARVGITDQGAYERTSCTGFIAALTPANSTVTCANPSVTLTASAAGATSYSLSDGQTNSTGEFAISAQGLYTVTASNGSGCTAMASALVAREPLPTAFAVNGGGAYCAGGAGVAVGLANSQSGVNYQLKRDNSNVGTPESGTGAALSFGNQTLVGTYTVTATNATTGCTADMNGSATVTVNPLPTAYTVSGGGAYCVGGPGVAVGLANSQSGVNYQLKRDNSNVGTPESGTGAALSFGNQAIVGTYTVTATNATTGCIADMTGSATVTVNAPPTVTPGPNQSVIFGFGSNCTNISASATGAATLSYAWNNGAGNGATVNVCPQTTTTYTVTATDGNGCQATGQVTVNVRDVRCGNQNQNVTICYYGVTQCVSEKIAARYLKLGATIGGCGTGNARIGVEEASVPLQLSLKAFPNPVQDAMTLEVLAPNAGGGTFEVLDLTGRVRQSRQENLIEGLNEVEFRLGSLPTGIYLIRAVDAQNRQGVVRVSKE